MPSSDSWNRLSDRPRVDELRESVRRILAAFGDEVAFVVLYGSVARGDHSADSDFDLLIGLCGRSEERFLDRLYRFGRLTRGPVEVLVYDEPETAAMLEGRHPLLLEALADGLALHDTGPFAALRARFEAALHAGAFRRVPDGWDLLEPHREP